MDDPKDFIRNGLMALIRGDEDKTAFRISSILISFCEFIQYYLQ
jgi:hypothetical protein